MKIRTRLILAFLLLAVLPLTAIVAYSYLSSSHALRRATEEELTIQAGELDRRLTAVREDVTARFQRIGELPLDQLTGSAEHRHGDAVLRRIIAEMGDSAELIESFEITPAPPAPALAPRAPLPPSAPTPLEASPGAHAPAVVIDVPELVALLGEAAHDPEAAREAGIGIGLEVAGRVAQIFTAEEIALETVRERIEAAEGEVTREAMEFSGSAEQEAEARAAAAELRLERRMRRVLRMKDRPSALAGEIELPVRAEFGELRARLDAERFVAGVLGSARRDRGEIPFALDADGRLYASGDDEPVLADLDIAAIAAGGGHNLVGGGADAWMVVSRRDAVTGLIFGLARPLGERLADLRRSALRNLGFGLTLIAIALIGILPLSRRLTRDVQRLGDGAQRIAGGDLESRVEVRSKDELGALATTFNQMAAELAESRARLLTEERRRRQEEVERSLLAADNHRKTHELEEARRFQLSLLPKSLPEHPDFEVAVFMSTATEVGGDYYDFHLEEGGELTVAVGDATGHGARAGTMVTVVKSLFAAAGGQRDPGAFLADATQTVRAMELGRMAMALLVARLAEGRLTVASAGMPPALVHRAADGEVEELALSGMPLGGLDTGYEERSVDLSPGDTVVLMSDGFPELADRRGEPLGYAAVGQLISRHAGGPPTLLLDALAEAARARREGVDRGNAPDDDVTFVAVRYRGP